MSISLLSVAFFANISAANAATLTVCTTGCDYTALSAAVSGARNGDTIEVERRTWDFEALYITKNLSIVGAPGESGQATFDGSALSAGTTRDWIVTSSASVHMQDVAFTGGGSTFDVLNYGDTTIEDCDFSGNVDGPPVINLGTMSLSGVTISGNASTAYTAGVYSYGDISVSDTEISGNTASGAGSYAGGFYTDGGGSVSFSGVDVSGNTGPTGGLYIAAGPVEATSTTISGNHGKTYGGGAYIVDGGELSLSSDSSMSGNTSVRWTECQADADSTCPAGTVTPVREVCATGCDYADLSGALADAEDGDLIEIEQGTWDFEDVTIEADVIIAADLDGTGTTVMDGSGWSETDLGEWWVDADASVTISNIEFDGGGGVIRVYNEGTVTIEDALFTGNDGYAPLLNHGAMTLQDVQISGNTSSQHTAGVYTSGELDIIDSAIINNAIDGGTSTAAGGLVARDGALVRVKRSRIADNTGPVGGVQISASEVRLTRSKIVDNHGEDYAGGALLRDGAVLYLWTQSTLSSNTSDTTTAQCEALDTASTCP